MVIRENYLTKIRPFIGKDIIKVLTGIRRGGKSVLLEQIRDEIGSPNTIVLNFEDLGNQRLCEYNALHDYVDTGSAGLGECGQLPAGEIPCGHLHHRLQLPVAVW